MEPIMIDILQGAGPAGAIAIVVLWMYRQAVKQQREYRRFSEDRIAKLVERDRESRDRHTTALTELITWLKARNGH